MRKGSQGQQELQSEDTIKNKIYKPKEFFLETSLILNRLIAVL